MFNFKNLQDIATDLRSSNFDVYVFAADLEEIVNFSKEKWQSEYEVYKNGDVIRFGFGAGAFMPQIYMLHEIFMNILQFNQMK